MFYIWRYDTSGKGSFFHCGIEKFDGWDDIRWTSGVKITTPMPKVLRYNAANKLLPEDYPMTPSSWQFLVSKKIVDVFKELNIDGVDSYYSEICRPNGEVLPDFYTLNILNVLECIDKDKSEFKVMKLGPAEVYEFKKICLDYSKIPSNVAIFRSDEDVNLIFVREDIKELFERKGITGVVFESVCGC